ncbi:hypothetical protein IV454_19385 [Massilia antarctica]|uniref:Uncharacterized protein n=1 Tax=Massilia antarctica TaxID=2765360 RepID=A0AA48WA54_9BURK|nr:hypothetical protein [Massilia antarctica]QPI47739.1 hypothetical protein IV454_19385 [Massilia antarctica]
MDAKIEFVKDWSDDDMSQLTISICDGASRFCHEVYVGPQRLRDAVRGLDGFKDDVYGGTYDLRFGVFGPAYAAGAFHAHFQFDQHADLLITVHAQSRFVEFPVNEVASEITLYLTALPSQLDDFVRALRAVSDGHADSATLDATGPYY